VDGRDDIVPGVEEGVKDQLLLVWARLWKHSEEIEQKADQKTGATAGERGERLVIAFCCKNEDNTLYSIRRLLVGIARCLNPQCESAIKANDAE